MADMKIGLKKPELEYDKAFLDVTVSGGITSHCTDTKPDGGQEIVVNNQLSLISQQEGHPLNGLVDPVVYSSCGDLSESYLPGVNLSLAAGPNFRFTGPQRKFFLDLIPRLGLEFQTEKYAVSPDSGHYDPSNYIESQLNRARLYQVGAALTVEGRFLVDVSKNTGDEKTSPVNIGLGVLGGVHLQYATLGNPTTSGYINGGDPGPINTRSPDGRPNLLVGGGEFAARAYLPHPFFIQFSVAHDNRIIQNVNRGAQVLAGHTDADGNNYYAHAYTTSQDEDGNASAVNMRLGQNKPRLGFMLGVSIPFGSEGGKQTTSGSSEYEE